MPVWKVHVGAHKTATTHLQELLEANASRLLSHGVDVIPVEHSSKEVRFNGRIKGSPLNRIISKIGSSPNFPRFHTARLPFSQFRTGQALTILSHEDQLGFTQDLLRPHFYSGSERWATLDRIAPFVDLDIYLSVRSFDTLFVSAFCEILKPFPDARRRFEARRATLRQIPPSWAELAHRIAARYQSARVHVWRFEDYTVDPSYVFKSLTKIDMADATKEVPSKTRSPSARAIKLSEALDLSLDVRTRMEFVQEIYDAHPKSPGERIDLFSDEEINWLQELYHRDIDAIAQSNQLSLMLPRS
ncbi:MAG: hypothetical protein V2I43_14045 [Parvularcula sp.]|jgi:hypothetical protein|nr:hypothetical protein [Parvularcula sp.]